MIETEKKFLKFKSVCYLTCCIQKSLHSHYLSYYFVSLPNEYLWILSRTFAKLLFLWIVHRLYSCEWENMTAFNVKTTYVYHAYYKYTYYFKKSLNYSMVQNLKVYYWVINNEEHKNSTQINHSFSYLWLEPADQDIEFKRIFTWSFIYNILFASKDIPYNQSTQQVV